MNFRNDSFVIDAPGKVKPLEGLQLNAVMRNVYGWMTMGLLVTTAMALAVSNSGIYPLTRCALDRDHRCNFGIVHRA